MIFRFHLPGIFQQKMFFLFFFLQRASPFRRNIIVHIIRCLRHSVHCSMMLPNIQIKILVINQACVFLSTTPIFYPSSWPESYLVRTIEWLPFYTYLLQSLKALSLGSLGNHNLYVHQSSGPFSPSNPAVKRGRRMVAAIPGPTLNNCTQRLPKSVDFLFRRS